jgi:hypothetical protein
MSTTKKGQTPERTLNLEAGQAAFKSLETTLRVMPADDVMIPNSDAQDSAIAALNLVSVARTPARMARLALLPEALFAKDNLAQLELAAWATWYAHTQVLSGQAAANGARVEAALFESAGQHLAKLLKLLEYHVGSIPDVAAELADIRSGSGYQDRASDLMRAAILWERWRAELEGDKRLFDAGDGQKAKALAEAIVTALRASLGTNLAEQADLRNRAWSLLSRLYNEVRAAGLFVFRNDPAELEHFAPMRQVVTSRSRSKATEGQTPNGATAAPAAST